MSTEIRYDPDPSSTRHAPNIPRSNQVAITDTAMPVVGRRAGRGAVTLQNLDEDNNVYIGNEDVTDETGFRLKPGEGITITAHDQIFAICASGQTAIVGYLEDAA